MGYEINSPVKQVWLPLDYDFIHNMDSENFGNFAKEYKEKYGIDLHDVLELKTNEDGYYVASKVDLLGAYLKNHPYYKTKFALNNAVKTFTTTEQSQSAIVIFMIALFDHQNQFSFGFRLLLPVASEQINTIDDLVIALEEN